MGLGQTQDKSKKAKSYQISNSHANSRLFALTNLMHEVHGQKDKGRQRFENGPNKKGGSAARKLQ